MPSIKEVARLSGVSIATVSRVINNKESVSKETAEKVWKAVRLLNYQPNLLARSLRSQQSRLLGLLVPDIESPVFGRLAKYLEEAASKKGYSLIFCNTNDNPEKEKKYLEILIQRQIEGIIFSRVLDESLLFKTPQLSKIPYVVLDRTLEKEEAPTIKLDNYAAGALAASHFLNLGHKKFACLSGPLRIKICRERFYGFLDTLEKSGMSLREELIEEGDFKMDEGRKAMNRILTVSLFEQPTAVFSMNDLMALGAIQAIKERGLSVPGDVSIIGLDNIPLCDVISPPLTTVAQPFDEMAKEGINLLSKLIEGKKIRRTTIVVQPELVIRNSTAPPRKR
ncbi:MAG TPA: LacI family DNA-binding transcriptional regulator [Candidatus Atribacteria bacterium]|nr:LacI family DNA-binding transcriptional regulator [Candidatus Atribacteria bacterium]